MTGSTRKTTLTDMGFAGWLTSVDRTRLAVTGGGDGSIVTVGNQGVVTVSKDLTN